MNKLFTKEKLSDKNPAESGQTLLFVVVMMTIALAAGVSISVNTISSLSRTSQSDTSSRVSAAAEAGIERLLNTPNNVLSLIDTTPNSTNCGLIPGVTYDATSNKCLLTITTPSSGDAITSTALLDASSFNYNKTSPVSHYFFNLKNGVVKEVNLSGYSAANVQVCWTPTSSTGADLFYITYNSSGIQESAGVQGNASSNGYDRHGFKPQPGGANGFTYCQTVAANGMYGLRLRSLAGDAKVGVFPLNGGTLPSQGYMLESTGVLSQDPNTKRKIVAYKSVPYLSGIFDFSIFANQGIQ